MGSRGNAGRMARRMRGRSGRPSSDRWLFGSASSARSSAFEDEDKPSRERPRLDRELSRLRILRVDRLPLYAGDRTGDGASLRSSMRLSRPARREPRADPLRALLLRRAPALEGRRGSPPPLLRTASRSLRHFEPRASSLLDLLDRRSLSVGRDALLREELGIGGGRVRWKRFQRRETLASGTG